MKRKNIAIIIHKLYGGGAEHAACNLSLFLQDQCETTLIAFDARNAAYPHTDNTIDLAVPAAKNFMQRALLLPKRVYRLRKLKQERNIDVSIALLAGPSMANALSRTRGEKSIMSVRNFLSIQEGSKGFAAFKTRLSASLSDCVVAVSRLAALDLHKNFGIPENKIRVIYNAVDPSLLSYTCNESVPWIQRSGQLVVTMGRLHNQKAHWHLLRAMADVIKKIPDAKLLILGDGEYKERLQKLAVELNIENNVFMPGYVASPHGYVRRADLFVLSSLYEGMPNAMLEAMACGIPVVSTDCPSGPREILAPDTSISVVASELEKAKYGILVPPLDTNGFNAKDQLTVQEKELSEAIYSMLSDSHMHAEYTQKAVSRAADFAPKIIAEQWHALIESLCDNEEGT